MDLEALTPSVLSEVIKHDIIQPTLRDVENLIVASEHAAQSGNGGLAMEIFLIANSIKGRFHLLLKASQVVAEKYADSNT